MLEPLEPATSTRSRRLPRLHPDSLIALLGVSVLVLANAIWVVTQRLGQPLDIDESGSVRISLVDYHGLLNGGIVGWWHQIVGQTVQAPLGPALASFLDWVTGLRILNAFFVSVLAYGITLMATLGLTKNWTRLGRGLALLFVALSPVLLTYSRGFDFAELASACLASALYFGHRSRCFTRTVPSLAWGACLGLMLLSRTMTVAFLPGLLVAVLVPVFARRSWSGLLRIGAGFVVGAAVAGTWYVHNFEGVYSYLTSAGYGSQAALYGPARSVFSLDDWYQFLLANANTYLYAGEAFFVAVGWLACVGVVIQKCVPLRPLGIKLHSLFDPFRTGAASNPVVLSCAIVAVTGMGALMSSRNEGSGFLAPLVVPLVIVASWGATKSLALVRAWWPPTPGAVFTLALATVLTALTLVSAALTFLPMSVEAVTSVPFPNGDRLTLWDSAEGSFRRYEDNAGVPFSAGKAWVAVSAFADNAIWEKSEAVGRPPVAVLTFNQYMINVNTVSLDSAIHHQSGLELALMNPLPGYNGTAEYLGQIKWIDPIVTVVATVTGGVDEFQPAVPVSVGIDYVSSLHFKQFARYRLPDGEWLVLWSRG
jgi:hypothetical protein